jgi:hypothetical protein
MEKLVLLITVCLAMMGAEVRGQQEGEAGATPILLQQGSKTVRIRPGRRITAVGPSEEVAVKGRLIDAKDSIVIQLPKRSHENGVRKLAASDVISIHRKRLGWKVAGLYFTLQAIVAFATGFFSFLPLGALIVTGLQMFFGVIVIAICLYLSFRKYNLPPWRLG